MAGLNNINNLKKDNIVEVINAINLLLGNLQDFSTNENLSNKTDLVNAILKLSTIIGAWGTGSTYQWTAVPAFDRIKDFNTKNYTNIIEYLNEVDKWLRQLQETKVTTATFDNWINLINNLAENMDILDANVNMIIDKVDLGNTGSTTGPTLPGNTGGSSNNNTSLTWGSF